MRIFRTYFSFIQGGETSKNHNNNEWKWVFFLNTEKTHLYLFWKIMSREKLR